MTTLLRRTLLASLAAAPAWAQSFPERPVRLLVPFPPGGSTDSSARVIAEFLSARYGKPVLVENRAGAGGTIAAAEVARAAPDGYTWLIGSPGNLANANLLLPNLPYVPLRDLAPVSLVFTTDHVVTVNPATPVATIPEFVAYARSRPKPLSFGSSGTGASLHLIGELFRQKAGIELIHVPYRGSAPAVNDLIAGVIDCMFDQLPASIVQVQGGRLRALATTGPKRNRQMPDTPTVGETLPGFEAQSWNGIAVPAATPPALVARISADLGVALADPGVQAKLAPLGADYAASSPEAFGAIMKTEEAVWGPIIRSLNITAAG